MMGRIEVSLEAQQEEHITQLIVALGDLDVGTRWDAAGKLAAIGEEAVPALIELIAHVEWSVKHIAVWALGEIRSTQGIDPLLTALHDDHFHVRLSAARGLEKSDDPRAVQALAQWKTEQARI
jgi:HEAT repeat protein